MATADLSRSFLRLSLRPSSRCTFSPAAAATTGPPKAPHLPRSRRHYATTQEPITPAPPIDLATFKPPPIKPSRVDLKRLRIVPASTSYFSGRPQFTDDYLMLVALLAKWQRLPTCLPGEAPRALWLGADAYAASVSEPVKPSRYARMVGLLRRLNAILPQVMPAEVAATLERFKRAIDPSLNQPRPILVDEHGRARAVGRRKESSAVVWLVEGDGEVLVNGKKLHAAFPRLHDRESVVWPLKATQRLDKYNVFGIVRGGGTTGQAEALTLGIARALMAHEPDIKTYLRKAGVVTRDPRMVERKKPGKRKARKMPAWVKR